MHNDSNEINNNSKVDEFESVQLAFLLHSVNIVSTKLITASPDEFEQTIWESLKIIGRAVNAQRTYIWQNFVKSGKLCCQQTHEWSEDVKSLKGQDFTIMTDYDDVPYWRKTLLSGKNINGPVKYLPDEERNILQIQGIISVLIIPIMHAGQFWGFIGFDECKNERYFSSLEEHVLQSSGILMASTIIRNNITQNIITTRNHLHKQDILLRAVNSMATLLMEDPQEYFGDIVLKALGILGESVRMDNAYIWKNNTQDDNLIGLQLAEWSRYKASIYGSSTVEPIIYDDVIPQWREMVETRNSFTAYIYDAINNMLNLPVTKEVISITIMPIILQGDFWGFIGFDNCHDESLLDDSQIDILKSSGMLIASAIMRNEMTASLVEAREKALASTKAKSEFLSRMSHEIRTPLNAIIGMAAIASKSDDFNKIKQCLKKIDSSSKQLLSIVNDVLDMSKIDANKLEINNIEFNFDKMMENVYNVIQAKADEKSQKFSFDLKQVLTHNIISDELRLSQVMLNLLSNAVKFTPDGGKVSLYAQEIPINNKSSTLHIEVKDSGIGIPADRIPYLFQSFEQVDGSITRKYGGTGLGLAICKKILNIMNGHIWVESELGKGSIFTFEINVNIDDNSVNKVITSELHDENHTENNYNDYNWSDKQLLLVEDIDINSEIILALLEHTKIKIDCAYNGCQALEMYKSAPDKYDLVLMDVQMPEMDGLTATKQIRASNLYRCSSIPIVAMTANAFNEDKNNCFEAGMNSYLAKPIQVEQLFEVLACHF